MLTYSSSIVQPVSLVLFLGYIYPYPSLLDMLKLHPAIAVILCIWMYFYLCHLWHAPKQGTQKMIFIIEKKDVKPSLQPKVCHIIWQLTIDASASICFPLSINVQFLLYFLKRLYIYAWCTLDLWNICCWPVYLWFVSIRFTCASNNRVCNF